MASIAKFVERMRYYCDQANVGYDQSRRWALRPNGEVDCSSLVIGCLREAGFDTGSAGYTGNMRSELTKRGWAVVAVNGSPQVGDILLNDVHHVAACVAPGMLSQASIDERGRASGGQSGDQTNHETNTRSYYNYPWNCYLRFVGGGTAPATSAGKLEVDGVAGYATIAKWQQVMGTPVDGIVSGQEVPNGRTYSRPNLLTSQVRYSGKGSDLIKAVQRKLGVKLVDGLLGPDTIAAIQKHLGTYVQGQAIKVFGHTTVKALQRNLNAGRF